MLIVLEGLDGAGKSTQIRMLTDWLQAAGKKVYYLHFPRFDAPVSGPLIARYLRGDFGPVDRVHPMLVALLFAEDRRLAADGIRRRLAAGEAVLLDRYVYSNVAFQCAKAADRREAELLRNWILDTEFRDFGIPEPDLNLFLDVPIGFVGRKLSETRTGDDRAYLEGKVDIHEADLDFQVRVREVYRQECVRNSRLLRIDCQDETGDMASAATIFARIREQVESYWKRQQAL